MIADLFSYSSSTSALPNSMRKGSARLQTEKVADDIGEQLRLEAMESMEGVNSALRLFFSALYRGKVG